MKRAVWVFALILAALPTHAATITVGTASVVPGGSVSVPVNFASQGTPVSTFQVDLAFSIPIYNFSSTLSSAAAVAGKELSATPISGGVRLLVSGNTATMVPDGAVITLTFFVAATAAPGTYAINASHATAADFSGLPAPITAVSGSIVVGSPAAAAWILPSSAHTPGQNGATWTTDLTVANTGTTAGSFTLKFLGHDADGRSGPELGFSIPVGKTTVLADVLSLFNISNGYGALQVSGTVTTLAISGQTSTAGNACVGGSFGQSVPAVASTALIATGSPRSIVGVREDASFHTNLVLANGAQAGCDVNVSLVDGNGTTLATKLYTLQPLGMTQLTNVARVLGVTANVAGARLVIAPVTNGATVAAYASVIDNATNDPRTLLPQ